MSAEQGARIPRFQVQITAAYAELAQDLARLPPRTRPERLRALAMVGVAVMSGKIGALSTPGTALPAPSELSEPTADPQLGRRLRLLEAISADA
ncbi:hypothetical protein [Candidatus Thiodictyon syntrophicum]|jgi:hypothetical protein|uniref:Uncharacterized protein n=1 Tax=Candidatus Thiodictyon syntrophicum TaxID=1166950 RepID=A0A2K8UI90_9GAMM|nr:hypothetical protein [Candidatus Thiodictyon syntrophicum]AUB85199.1 hypothetical protein THSYN_30240 [Candidatus Thiodictyon syntrophicum]